MFCLFRAFISTVFLSLLLSACGGGGSGNGSEPAADPYSLFVGQAKLTVTPTELLSLNTSHPIPASTGSRFNVLVNGVTGGEAVLDSSGALSWMVPADLLPGTHAFELTDGQGRKFSGSFESVAAPSIQNPRSELESQIDQVSALIADVMATDTYMGAHGSTGPLKDVLDQLQASRGDLDAQAESVLLFAARFLKVNAVQFDSADKLGKDLNCDQESEDFVLAVGKLAHSAAAAAVVTTGVFLINPLAGAIAAGASIGWYWYNITEVLGTLVRLLDCSITTAFRLVLEDGELKQAHKATLNTLSFNHNQSRTFGIYETQILPENIRTALVTLRGVIDDVAESLASELPSNEREIEAEAADYVLLGVSDNVEGSILLATGNQVELKFSAKDPSFSEAINFSFSLRGELEQSFSAVLNPAIAPVARTTAVQVLHGESQDAFIDADNFDVLSIDADEAGPVSIIDAESGQFRVNALAQGVACQDFQVPYTVSNSVGSSQGTIFVDFVCPVKRVEFEIRDFVEFNGEILDTETFLSDSDSEVRITVTGEAEPVAYRIWYQLADGSYDDLTAPIPAQFRFSPDFVDGKHVEKWELDFSSLNLDLSRRASTGSWNFAISVDDKHGRTSQSSQFQYIRYVVQTDINFPADGGVKQLDLPNIADHLSPATFECTGGNPVSLVVRDYPYEEESCVEGERKDGIDVEFWTVEPTPRHGTLSTPGNGFSRLDGHSVCPSYDFIRVYTTDRNMGCD